MSAKDIEWTREFGTSSYDEANAVAFDDSGIYVAGRTLGALPGQTSSGGEDAFVRKYDSAGSELWTRQFGSSGYENARAVAVGGSGVYVAGYTNGTLPGVDASPPGEDAFLRKYDPAGVELWTRQWSSTNPDLGASNVQAFRLAVDDSGVFVVGWTDGALPGQNYSGICCPPDVDAFVRKYDHAGGEVWTRQFGEYAAYGATVDTSGVYVAGITGPPKGAYDAYIRKFDPAGGDGWRHVIDYPDLSVRAFDIVSDSSGVYVVGTTATVVLPTSHAWVLKYDTDGAQIWNRTISTNETDWAGAVSIDSSGIYVLGGSDAGSFVRQYDASGNEVWSQQYDPAAIVRDLDVSSSVVGVAGVTTAALPGQVNHGAADAFVMKISDPPPVNQPPVAFASATPIGPAHIGEAVTFDASASSDDRGIVEYRWDFRDGNSGIGVVVEHAYAVRGSFEVVLTVRDAAGVEAQDSVVVEVVNRGPIANAGPDQTVPKRATVTLDGGGSTDGDADALTYFWSQVAGPAVPLLGADTATPTFLSPGAGVYRFELTVNDGAGGTASDSVQVTARNGNPVISTANPGEGQVQLAVSERRTFSVQVSDPDGDALTYVWSVDGVEVSRLGPGYEMGVSDPGTHVLRVTVSDGESTVSRQWTVIVGVVRAATSDSLPWSELVLPVVLLLLPLVIVSLLRPRRTRRP